MRTTLHLHDAQRIENKRHNYKYFVLFGYMISCDVGVHSSAVSLHGVGVLPRLVPPVTRRKWHHRGKRSQKLVVDSRDQLRCCLAGVMYCHCCGIAGPGHGIYHLAEGTLRRLLTRIMKLGVLEMFKVADS